MFCWGICTISCAIVWKPVLQNCFFLACFFILFALQVVKKSVKLHQLARYLVEHCGLFSWLSSVLSFSSGRLFEDEKSFSLMQLLVVLEVIYSFPLGSTNFRLCCSLILLLCIEFPSIFFNGGIPFVPFFLQWEGFFFRGGQVALRFCKKKMIICILQLNDAFSILVKWRLVRYIGKPLKMLCHQNFIYNTTTAGFHLLYLMI